MNMLTELWGKSVAFKVAMVVVLIVVIFGGATSAYAWYYRDRVIPNTYIGVHPVGGLSRDEVAQRVQEAMSSLELSGIRLAIEGSSELIPPENIGLDINLSQAVDDAFRAGHNGSSFTQYRERLSALWRTTRLEAPVTYDQGALAAQIRDVAELMDATRRDVRIQVKGTEVELATDTSVGRVIDQTEVAGDIVKALRALDSSVIELRLHDDPPRADPELAQLAVNDARAMVARPIQISYEDMRFTVSRTVLAQWLVSEYENDQLKAGIDTEAVSMYVTTVAAAVNIPPEPARITTEDGRVTGFTPPKIGRAVQEDKLIEMILGVIRSRTTDKPSGDNLIVPLKTTTISLEGLDSGAGIVELIGKATTPFTGSPRNRISNIKNGVKFLTGTIVPPGSEFSTLGTLGTIDNTTGYLPELVIKGDRTTPEFGGGLCQVSTTLFRAVMDAGLPVTARRNHSYRVTYYEKDGNGRVIGPGLDATIYEPQPDFKFRNDMATPVLIIGYVIGDKATFELYGTKDGRTSEIDGPHTLTTTPSGDPKYIDEPSLAVGVKKQVEVAHPGGSAIATYTITYPDGTEKATEFSSWYRPWPAVYLVGTGGVTPTPFPVSPPLPTLSPTP